MSCRFTTSCSQRQRRRTSPALSLAPPAAAARCAGRKQIQEANELYKRGRYHEAVAAFEAGGGAGPDLPTLWLNKGYTCRQLIAPGGQDPDSRRAADCALAAFQRLARAGAAAIRAPIS